MRSGNITDIALAVKARDSNTTSIAEVQKVRGEAERARRRVAEAQVIELQKALWSACNEISALVQGRKQHSPTDLEDMVDTWRIVARGYM